MRQNLLLLLLVPALPALAEDEPAPANALLKHRDADRDGRLSPAEFGPDRELFDLLDRDGDGFLTAQELPRPRKPRGEGSQEGADRARKQAEKFLKENDKDGDGRIGMSEWPISSRPLMDFDGNGDQVLDLDEVSRFFAGRGDGRRRGPGDAPPEGMPGGPGGPADREPMAGRPGGPDHAHVRELAEGLLRRLDKDGDGKISGEEMPKEGRPDLSKADRNGDGGIDLFELTVVVAERAGEAGDGRMLARRLKQMDSNGDGVVERAEWKGPPERFDLVDGDRDGRITEAEAKQALSAMGGEGRGEGRWMDRNADAAFRRFDADGDGRITAEEWKARPETFAMLDANKDGAVTREELTPKGPARARRGGGPDVRSGKDSAHFLGKYDANRDGQVTREEFPHERRFSEIDADGNGVLSKAEIEESVDRVRNEGEYGIFERFDLDGDGRITREEFTGPAADFERLDRNRDGVLDKSDGADSAK
jgi:Ca2+-binding EF-hand superfamily protein